MAANDNTMIPAGGIRFGGKTYRQGDRLPRRYFRQAEARLRDPAAGSRALPPNMGRPVLPHTFTFSGMVSSLSRAYMPSDEALIDSVENAHMMLTDPDIFGPLFARQMMVALLNLSVESEDDKNPILKGVADELKSILQETPRFTEYKRSLGEGIWYGRTAIQNEFRVSKGLDGKHRIYIGKWTPLSGDKLVFRFDDGTGRYSPDQVGVRVSRSALVADKFAGPFELEPTQQGMSYFLKPWERSKISIHKYMIRDGEYEDITTGGSIHGIGLRSFLYWIWYQKQETLRQAVELIERTGSGITIYYYPEGNDKAKAEIDDVAKAQSHTNILKMPHQTADPDAYRIEQLPPNTAGLDALMDIVDNYFGDKILRVILGQTLSQKATATGLGSGVADLHKESLSDIVRYDAINLEETLTTEVLWPLRDYNFPKLRGVKFRVKLATEADASEAALQKIKQAWDMGAKIRAADLMDRIGLSTPKHDEPAIYNAQLVSAMQQLENPQPPPMMGGPGGPGTPPSDPGNPAGGGGNPPNTEDGPDDGPGTPGGDDGGPMPQSMDGNGRDVSKLYGPILYRKEVQRYRRNEKLREAIAAAVEATHTDPTEEQIEAGNYPKGKFWWGGWQLAIETPKGEARHGWDIPLAAHYGYIRRTVSEADGDHIDAFIGPEPEAEIVYVVDQLTRAGRFDEHKVLIGFPDRKTAVQAYLDCYPAGWKCGPVTALTVWQFRAWLTSGDTSKPMERQVSRYAKRSKGTPAAGSFNFDEEKHPRESDGTFAAKGEGEVKHGGAEQVPAKDFLTDKPEPAPHKKGDFTPAEKKKQTGFLLGQYDDPDQGLLFGDASKPEAKKPAAMPEEPKAKSHEEIALAAQASGQHIKDAMKEAGLSHLDAAHRREFLPIWEKASQVHKARIAAEKEAATSPGRKAAQEKRKATDAAAVRPNDLADTLEAEHPGLKLDLYDKTRKGTGKVWELAKIVVPPGERGQGKGTAIMEKITAAADAAGATLALDPSTDFGATSRARLERFYAGHGFVKNKGRTADLAISAAMIRTPTAKPAAEEPPAEPGLEPDDIPGEEWDGLPRDGYDEPMPDEPTPYEGPSLRPLPEPEPEPASAAAEEVPEHVREHVQRHLDALRGHAESIAQGTRLDEKFGGTRYADELREKLRDKIAAHHATLDEFRQLAAAKGIDHAKVIEELGGVPDTGGPAANSERDVSPEAEPSATPPAPAGEPDYEAAASHAHASGKTKAEAIADAMKAHGIDAGNWRETIKVAKHYDAMDKQKYAKRPPPFRYAVRHAPKGGVNIGGKQFTGGQFIPNEDYDKADPQTKAAIDGQTTKAGESSEHRIGAMDVGAKITDPQGVEWTHKGKGMWQDAGGAVSNGRGYYPAGVMSRFAGDHAKVHEAIDAWHATQKPAEAPAPAGLSDEQKAGILAQLGGQPAAPPDAAAASAIATPEQRQSAKEALWSQGEIDRVQKIIDGLQASGATINGGQSPLANEYIRRVKELKAHTAEYNAHVRAAGATSPEHLLELAGKTPAPAATPPAAPPAPPPSAGGATVTAPPDPNAGSGDLAGTLDKAPDGTKVGEWTKKGDRWNHKLGSSFTTPQMIGHEVKKGNGDALNAAVDKLTQPTTPGAGQPNATTGGSKSPAPGASTTGSRGRIDPARMTTHDRANLSTVAGIFGINPGDAKNADRAANFALLAARKLGLDPPGADKNEQTNAATRYLAQQKPKLDAMIDTAAKLGYKGKAQTLVQRYKGAGEHIVKAATAAGYQGSGQYDQDDIMGALSHLSTVRSPAETPLEAPDAGPLPMPAGPGGVRPGQKQPTIEERRAAAAATPGATKRPPIAGADKEPPATMAAIIDALSQKVGGKVHLAAAVGVIAALWYAFSQQQKRGFYDKAAEGGFNVLRYEE